MALDTPAERGSAAAEDPQRPRPHEILAAGYFALTGLLVVAYGRPLAEWWPILLLHAALVFACLRLLPALPDRRGPGTLRDWLPIFLFPLIYTEIARLNDLLTAGYFDRAILRIEAALFGTQPSVVLRQLAPSRVLSEYLHLGYLAYYAVGPALAGSLYLERRYQAFRYAVMVNFAVYFFCYLWFIVLPVAGPWYVFRRPSPDSMGWVVPHIQHAILARGASEGAAFPSSHVAAALASWLLAWQLSRPVFWVLAPIVPALIVGTVYGGFHYATDALAGILLAVVGVAAGPWMWRALGGGAAPAPLGRRHVSTPASRR